MTLTSSIVRTAGGLDIEVRRGGHGIKVVYLPDAEGSPDAKFAEVLAQRFEVFAFAVPRAENVHDMALVCDDVLDALGLTNVPVVGHGVGGMLAAELAAHSPPRVAKLALIAPEGLSTQRLYRIGAPTRIVWGQDDQVVPVQQATELAAGIASCDTEILAGAGHLVTDEQPDAVADAVEAHLRAKAPGAHDGLHIKHIDDLPWHEVRVMLVNGVRSVVKNRFVDFGEHRTICHTWYDPGIALAKHSHFSEELIYILSGGIHIGDVWCPEGTAIVLEPGTYFGPLVAGPEGAYLLEAFPGIGVRSGQDRTGFDELSARLGIEVLPDPPFNPPVTT